MQLLNQIIVNRAARGEAVIQLLQGNLTAIPPDHAADILVISAYPGSYVPVPKTLIAGLYDKGIDVAVMAKNKEIDLREQLGCWLSAALPQAQQAICNFKRILCFEPAMQNAQHDAVVGNIFRCINTFAFNENNNVIAMPVLATGRQKVPIEKMLPAMLDAGLFWLENGLPLSCIKLVLLSDEQKNAALPIFNRAKQQYELKQSVENGMITGVDAFQQFEFTKTQALPGEESMAIIGSELKEMAQKENEAKVPVLGRRETRDGMKAPTRGIPQSPAQIKPAAGPVESQPTAATKPVQTVAGNASPNDGYDYFVSYAHKHADIIDAFVKSLERSNKKLNIFYDKTSIPPGGLWIKQISDAIQKSKKVLIFLSPDYSNSLVCWDEFQCAKLIEYNSRKQIIQTIYLYNDVSMPPMMGIYSWTDCREGDASKLEQIAAQIIKEVSA